MIPKEMYQAVAFETIAVASTAIGFTAAQINPTILTPCNGII